MGLKNTKGLSLFVEDYVLGDGEVKLALFDWEKVKETYQQRWFLSSIFGDITKTRIKLNFRVFGAARLIYRPGDKMVMRNVAAIQGYGPTIYATALEYARDKRLLGVVPETDPTKILEKPKKIWYQFAHGYSGKIALTPLPKGKHPDQWLNNAYTLLPSHSLVDYEGLKNRATKFKEKFPEQTHQVVLRAEVLKLLEKSVEAHQSPSKTILPSPPL